MKKSNIEIITTDKVENLEVRKYMEQFWTAYHKLFKDMDNLTHSEFQIRSHEMWHYRNLASEIQGDFFFISLWGLSEKAHKIYGDECDPTT